MTIMQFLQQTTLDTTSIYSTDAEWYIRKIGFDPIPLKCQGTPNKNWEISSPNFSMTGLMYDKKEVFWFATKQYKLEVLYKSKQLEYLKDVITLKNVHMGSDTKMVNLLTDLSWVSKVEEVMIVFCNHLLQEWENEANNRQPQAS